jgi:hypothetical protein
VFLFVLGTGRCGSTLVHEVLARHPDVGFISNVEDNLPGLRLLGRWNNTVYRKVPARFTQKGRLRYAPSEAYRLLERQVSPMLTMPFRDLNKDDVTPWIKRRVRDFFEKRAIAQARRIFSHKFTGWPRAGFLHDIFPSARFIHVVRDGRAVANSWLQMPWWLGYQGPQRWHWGPLPPEYEDEWNASGHSSVLLAGLGWKILLDAFDAAAAALPAASWLTVRYEDVVAEPRGRFAEMLDFAGLTWNSTFEAGFAKHTFTASRSEAFRRDLTPAQVATLEKSLAGHLARWGY